MDGYRIVIKGLVQGIGYRPFIAECAEKVNITGSVRNTDGIVTIYLACGEEKLGTFLEMIKREAPESAIVTDIEVQREAEVSEYVKEGVFGIIESQVLPEKSIPWIPADFATCSSCKEELLDRRNRRFRHPFISCVSCGPRYSIINDLPYDRENIVMEKFELCPSCAREYVAKGNVRRHAQTICCLDCGPKLELKYVSDHVTNKFLQKYGDPIKDAIAVIKAGGILAIKDIGGYHLACSPFDSKAVSTLRRIKNREGKPFALMFKDTKQVEKYCFVNDREKELLESTARPIVLLKKQYFIENNFVKGVCKSSPQIGAMLPCNPVQILLLEDSGPVIMTSANGSGDLLITDNDRMQDWMDQAFMELDKDTAIPFAILSHDRDINMPLDDSIVQVICGRTQTIRRARGYTPNPIDFPYGDKIFATGGDLKSSFCFVENGRAIISQHLGDLENEGSFAQFKKEYERMSRLFGFEPENFVTDMHPGYKSLLLGQELYECQKAYQEDIIHLEPDFKEFSLCRVQHHKAHVASVIAEHQLKGKVIGFSFDGTGYGEDKSIWGGEVFEFADEEIIRINSLKPVRLIGGNEGAKNCETILYGYISSFSLENQKYIIDYLKKYERFNESHFDLISKAFYYGLSTVITSSSMGRAFDAISALLGICAYNSYEGEAAIELENTASLSKCDRAFDLDISDSWNLENIFVEMVSQLEAGRPVAELARTFINTVAAYVSQLSLQSGIKQVALAGGTFCDRILVEKIIDNLKDADVDVYFNEKVSPGDGGLALGQAYLACMKG